MATQEKVKPPFPRISIFNVSAIILSFAGFKDDMEELLTLLCHNTSLYHRVHANILSAFLVPWTPDNAFTEIEFGSTVYPFNKVFPNT